MYELAKEIIANFNGKDLKSSEARADFNFKLWLAFFQGPHMHENAAMRVNSNMAYIML